MKTFGFVFPGQGSQSQGMLSAWGDHPVVQETLQEASDVLGQDMARLIREGPKEQLDLTTQTQPVMLTAGVACYRAWLQETGLKPAVVAGHSLGEYSALVAAEVLTFSQALPLVRLRAQAMQDAVPVGTGAMAAILGLEAQQVRTGCAEVVAACGDIVEPVNFNEPKQTVIAGSKAGVEKACEILKAQGAKRTVLLPVSAPFHSSLMRPAAEVLRARLMELELCRPSIAVINNIDVQSPTQASAMADALYRQAFGPVRWVETVLAMRERGVAAIFECGPGKVLTGFTKRIDAQLLAASVFDPTSLMEAKGVLA
jgi:[acyl-carrier-protein] S-malonyltransferase